MLWYVPVDIIAFARELGMALAVPFGSRENVCKLMELLKVIESTRYDLLPTVWRNRKNRAVDHHLSRCEVGGDFVYCDPFGRRKIEAVTKKSRL